MDMFFQSLVEWLGEFAERRFGRVGGCLAVLIATALVIAGVWLAWELLP
jgi:hypothetical protein